MKHFNSYYLTLLILSLYQIKPKLIASLVEIIRHGARSSSYFPNFSSTFLYGAEKNQLTHLGQMQHNLLGKILSKNYFDFFKNAKIYELRTSPKQRCIQSAYSNISGLYPFNRITFKNEYDDLKLNSEKILYDDHEVTLKESEQK